MSANRFAPEVEGVLRKAGWFPGRRVSEQRLQELELLRPLFPAARRFLEEFDELFVDLEFDRSREIMRFCIDAKTIWAEEGNSVWDDYAKAYGGSIYPIGYFGHEIEQGRLTGFSQMILDERERIFSVAFGPFLIGSTIDSAITSLIMGGGERHEWDLENDCPTIWG